MNEFECIEAEYIIFSRSLEVILVSNGTKKRIVYLYNHEGIHYRLFYTLFDVVEFFKNGGGISKNFEEDEKVDEYLGQMDLFKYYHLQPQSI